jgi:hypothetical protein
MTEDSFFGIEDELPSYPETKWPETLVFCGLKFKKARIRRPVRGIIQYREVVTMNSLHLKIDIRGKQPIFLIDHLDAYNPDMGHPIKHLLKDALGVL